MTVTTSVFAGRDGDILARCVSLDTNREREREKEIQKLVASVPFFSSSSSSSSRYFDNDENSK